MPETIPAKKSEMKDNASIFILTWELHLAIWAATILKTTEKQVQHKIELQFFLGILETVIRLYTLFGMSCTAKSFLFTYIVVDSRQV